MTCSRWRCLATALLPLPLPPPPPGQSARFFSCCPARRAAPGKGRDSSRGSSKSTSTSKSKSTRSSIINNNTNTNNNHSNNKDNNGPHWPHLKRKSSPLASSPFKETSFSIGQLARRSPRPELPRSTDLNASFVEADNGSTSLSTADWSRPMLVLEGLSPNLKASDFHRLLPSQLSSWSVIRRVQQKRCPKTLEPLGVYHITFTSESMLATYCDKFLRLHGLNKHRLRFADELLPEKWELSAPAHLRSGSDDLAQEANSLTFAPGSLTIKTPQRRRAGVRSNWWSQQLAPRLEQFGYGNSPPTVMVHVQPPTLTARDLAHMIHEDGCNRGSPWDVCEPLPLATEEDTAAAAEEESAAATVESFEQLLNPELNLVLGEVLEHKPDKDAKDTSLEADEENDDILDEDEVDPDTGKAYKSRPPVNYLLRERLRSRFVIVCADEAEAYRFQRSWNQRMLPGMSEDDASQSLVHVSRINW